MEKIKSVNIKTQYPHEKELIIAQYNEAEQKLRENYKFGVFFADDFEKNDIGYVWEEFDELIDAIDYTENFNERIQTIIRG